MRMIAALGVTLVLALGCGSGGDDDNSSNSSTSNSQTCNSTHECINGVCECTTPGIEGSPCTEDSCVADCEVCT